MERRLTRRVPALDAATLSRVTDAALQLPAIVRDVVQVDDGLATIGIGKSEKGEFLDEKKREFEPF